MMLTRAPISTFSPAEDAKAYRRSLGRFATGVTLVTAGARAEATGMIVNSFTSVSLDPALVLWCPAKGSNRYDHFINAKHFAINVLAEDQRPVCDRFLERADAFSPYDFDLTSGSAPLLLNAVARFECETHALHDAGDHTIVIGRVVRASEDRTKNPLIFADGGFCQLA